MIHTYYVWYQLYNIWYHTSYNIHHHHHHYLNSVIGHRLRAAHHAYFWLLNYKDAIESVRASVSHRQLDAMYKDIETHLHKLTHVKLEPARHSTIFPDKAKCYTDYEPRPLRDSSLKSKVLKGLAPSEKDKGELKCSWYLCPTLIFLPSMLYNNNNNIDNNRLEVHYLWATCRS